MTLDASTDLVEEDKKSPSIWEAWNGKNEFAMAQLKVTAILLLAVFGDRWEPSYPRNDNHNMTLFWIGHAILLVATIATWTRVPPRNGSSRVTLLSRPQTEEWKGWMQFAFIMYHYYRAWSAYNWIRVFVSSYVWMTGFGNFLYFDKKKDFSIERMVSMFIRINYFPLLLSWSTGVPLDLYYVVPLHTVGFFMTLITCWIAIKFETVLGMSYIQSRCGAILLCLIVHVAFYETSAVDMLLYFSEEIHLRFQIDKYSAWIGIVCGLLMGKASEYMTWAYGSVDRPHVQWMQRILGAGLIAMWYYGFGFIDDKHVYNPMNPYVFILALLGWLMIRNSSKYLSECHSTFLEFLGRNTLETYVLQFHLFMNHAVQQIPIIIPNSGADGSMICRILNMLVCGTIFVYVAIHARKVTVSTQTTVVELVTLVLKKVRGESLVEKEEMDVELVTPMISKTENAEEPKTEN